MHENNLVFVIIIGGIVCFFVIILPTIAWIIQTWCEKKYKRSDVDSSTSDLPEPKKATIIRTPSKIVYMSSHILNMCSPQEYYSICEMGNRYVKEFSASPPTLNYIVYSEPRPVVSGYPIQTVQLTHIYEPPPLSSAKKLDKKFDKEEPPPIYEPRKDLPKITNVYVLNDANERNYATICENSSESNLDQEMPEHMFVSTKL